MGVLDSKVIVITGGSMGIGFAVAKKCANEGATVVIAARHERDLRGALKKLTESSSREHCMYPLDVRRQEQVTKFSSWCSTKFPEIHGLVNCAGIYGPIGKSFQVDMDEFADTLQTNFLGTVYMCHEFIPLMKSKQRKKIVNYSGGGAASPFPRYSAYATSKIAVVRFTENLSIELAHDHFDVNCIAPGFVVTRIHQKTIEAGPQLATPEFFEKTTEQVESGGVSPDVPANLTVFLLSPESNGITGKFLSAPWDPWQDKKFHDLVRSDKDFASLRRIDNKTFFKKS